MSAVKVDLRELIGRRCWPPATRRRSLPPHGPKARRGGAGRSSARKGRHEALVCSRVCARPMRLDGAPGGRPRGPSGTWPKDGLEAPARGVRRRMSSCTPSRFRSGRNSAGPRARRRTNEAPIAASEPAQVLRGGSVWCSPPRRGGFVHPCSIMSHGCSLTPVVPGRPGCHAADVRGVGRPVKPPSVAPHAHNRNTVRTRGGLKNREEKGGRARSFSSSGEGAPQNSGTRGPGGES